MIKITPYTQLPTAERNKVLRFYLYLVSRVVPFYPEDVFPEGVFYPDGVKEIPIADYSPCPRRRAKDSNYTKEMSDFLQERGIAGDTEPKERKRNDALFAEDLIKRIAPDFHTYLYEGQREGHVNPQRLRKLLIDPVDQVTIDQTLAYKSTFRKDDKGPNPLLENVFRYEAFATKKDIATFVAMLGVEVCPYCNRLYVSTVPGKKGKSVRPQLDHYRSKSHYPIFALSILNLIPSCGVCNLIKGESELELLYPYAEGMGNAYAFHTESKDGITYLTGAMVDPEKFQIALRQTQEVEPQHHKRIKNSIEKLHLNELYNTHCRYVSNLFFHRYIFSRAMVQEIQGQFPELFSSEKSVWEMLLLGKIDEESWGNRPLAKLTHDIELELDQLYGEEDYFVSH